MLLMAPPSAVPPPWPARASLASDWLLTKTAERMEPLRVAVIGMGGYAKAHHNAIRELECQVRLFCWHSRPGWPVVLMPVPAPTRPAALTNSAPCRGRDFAGWCARVRDAGLRRRKQQSSSWRDGG